MVKLFPRNHGVIKSALHHPVTVLVHLWLIVEVLLPQNTCSSPPNKYTTFQKIWTNQTVQCIEKSEVVSWNKNLVNPLVFCSGTVCSTSKVEGGGICQLYEEVVFLPLLSFANFPSFAYFLKQHIGNDSQGRIWEFQFAGFVGVNVPWG